MSNIYQDNATTLLGNKQKEQTSIKVDIEMQNMNSDADYVALEEQRTPLTMPEKPKAVLQQPTQYMGYNNHPVYYQNLYNKNQQMYNRMNPGQVIQQKQLQIYAICIHCRTHQLIQNEKAPFMCFQCRQITNPLFESFKCGVCKITVKYQTGISPIIKCTKCNTQNLVPNAQMQARQAETEEKIFKLQ